MSTYVKISYKTKNVNQALMKCIMYIGKYYGKDNFDSLYSGISYISKRVKTSRRSIKFMIYSKKIKNSQMRQWKFKKKSYNRAYRYIINRLLNTKIGNQEEAFKLLHDLYLENSSYYPINNIFSDILVLEQKDLLNWSLDKPQYFNDQKYIEKILKTFDECDTEYSRYLK